MSNSTNIPYEKSLKYWCEQNGRQDLIDQYSDKNELPMDQVMPGSTQKVIWQMPYDDPKTGKHFDFEWKTECRVRTRGGRGDSCPYLAKNAAVWPGFNDLKTWCELNGRQDLIDQYSDKNKVPMDQIMPGSRQKVIWQMPYDDPKTGKHFDFEWETKCYNRTSGTQGCPYLAKRAVVWPGFNDLKTWCELNGRQDLVDQYSDKNEVPIDQIMPKVNRKVIWKLPYDDPETGRHFDFEWEARCDERTNGEGCPYLPPSCSEQESKIYLWLMNHNVDFIREQHFVIGNSEKKTSIMQFDIYLPDTNTVIECDHVSHISLQQREIDNVRDDFCKQHGIKVLRLPTDVIDWKTDRTIVNYDDQYKWLNEFLDTGKISDEIIALYDGKSVSNYGNTAREMNSDNFKVSYLKTMFESLEIPKADILKEHTGSNSRERSMCEFNKATVRTMAKQHVKSGVELLKTWSKKLNTEVRVRQTEGLVPHVLTGSDFEFN